MKNILLDQLNILRQQYKDFPDKRSTIALQAKVLQLALDIEQIKTQTNLKPTTSPPAVDAFRNQTIEELVKKTLF